MFNQKAITMVKTFITFAILLVLEMGTAQKPKIVIDPGHGGRDSGALGTNGILEKEVVLEIALECIRLNKSLLNDPLEIYLTRYKDTLISLQDRGRLAKSLKADAFVSIHCNQAPNPRAQGFEIFLHQKNNVHTAPGILAYALADSLGGQLQRNLGIKTRGIKWADFQVLRDIHGQIPAILFETGFISNETEAEYSNKRESKTAIALAILQSLIKTFYDD